MKISIVAVVACLVTVGQCRDVTVNLNVLDCMASGRHSSLVQLIKLANLTSLFTDPNSQVTVFAPPEGRNLQRDLRNVGLTLTALQSNTTLLASILGYHVVSGVHERSEMVNEKLFTTLNGQVLRTNHYVYNGQYYVDGSNLGRDVLRCNNGLVYSVQHLLYPIKGNMYDTIAADSQLTTLKKAVDAVGLGPFLKDQSPITLFAPTDDAFASLGLTLNTLLGKPDLLRSILTYHVIRGSLYKGGMHDGALHTFEEADRIALDRDFFGTSVDRARFKEYDISCSNGVIHKISDVLVPASLKDQI